MEEEEEDEERGTERASRLEYPYDQTRCVRTVLRTRHIISAGGARICCSFTDEHVGIFEALDEALPRSRPSGLDPFPRPAS